MEKEEEFLAAGFIWIIIAYHCDLPIMIIETEQPCYKTVWAYFSSRNYMQLHLNGIRDI